MQGSNSLILGPRERKREEMSFQSEAELPGPLPQGRHLISLSEQKGSDTFRENRVNQTAFQER